MSHFSKTLPLSLLLAVSCLNSCKKEAPPQAPPPSPVTVANPDLREAIVYAEFPATIDADKTIEIRARVRGVMEKQYFTDGQLVKKDEQLFLIEPEPYQQAVDAAEADLSRAKAAQELAQKRYDRLAQALKQNAVSQIETEIAAAELSQAAAGVKQAEAKLENAKLDLSYTKVISPISGRTSRASVSEGNLVGFAEPTLLTTVVDDTRVYVYFEVPERQMIRYFHARSDEDAAKRLKELKIRLKLADGSIYEKTGSIDFVDNQIDPSTRTNKVRAIFPNPKGLLASGLYGLVGVPISPDPDKPKEPKALVVPTESILRDIAGSFVWVVGEGNKVERRGVEPGKILPLDQTEGKKMSVILKGLDASDKVIVAGLQRAREGAVVAPQEAPKPAMEESKEGE
ncbi:RND family efflux transporter, MFP subunit [Rubritalea squalenifaciens DSM 18772]|uniref:RND family efflux transporter, MFP subunit n=1 Tax=Rubritalea squalenifaciens DSM 18772 TaxID=1123071 RepID=A0A1M6L0F7_9BACT|nr:efflux RND transporter periplasmic adaptor subunit [Rubritalea squalenifaciens]SHJ64680.1 RND family efflux transporter, MFP subunit [Rubritalea squalenifaciens DSM 18772]